MMAAQLIEGRNEQVLLVCDHASNAIPPGIELALPEAALDSHIAWDIGAADVARAVVGALGCPAWLACVSRLVVDCNRPPEQSVSEASDGQGIPGNIGLSPAALQQRLALHAGFHDGLAALVARGKPRLIVSIHSFTPQLKSAPAARPWPIAILWNSDARTAGLGLSALAGEADLGGPVGANMPYSGKELNYTMNRHAEANGIPALGFEIRQDLIGDMPGAARWAAIVTRTIQSVLAGL
ncbi:MAG: N-formylglutamate amidohydrolase, partial [Sandaracinobacteroides sp.]